MKPTISLITAVSHNYTIGHEGKMPWRLPLDLKRFKKITMGKPIIYGRKTYASMGMLKGRKNIVITHNKSFDPENKKVVVVHSIKEAIEAAGDVPEIMILGGTSIYDSFLPIADKLYMTVVHDIIEGDTKFPPIDSEQWRVSFQKSLKKDDKHAYDYWFLVLEREHYLLYEGTDRVLPDRYRPVTT